MAASIDHILNFYEDCARAGGLTTMPSLQMKAQVGVAHLPRFGPGFYADGENYHFGIDAYEHNGITFWTIQHYAKVSTAPRPPRAPFKLRLVSVDDYLAILLDESSGDKYSAPIDALLDSRPVSPEQPRPEENTIAWASLPEWVQFAVKPDSRGKLRGSLSGDHQSDWSANRRGWFKGSPQVMFASCLLWLDERGFDGTGEQKPDRSYYVSILQGGASLNLHARSDTGDRADLTVLNTHGHMSINLNYTPERGAPIPPTMPALFDPPV
jgi:hypothetical protein